MDSFRTRLVTNTSERFIQSTDENNQERWVIQNLGPAKIVVTGVTLTGDTTNELRPGDYLDIKCRAAAVNLASGESHDSIVRWMPLA
jgi:hypothetical protein